MPVDLSPSGGCAKLVPMAFLAGTEPKSGCGSSRGTAKIEAPADQAGDSDKPVAKPATEGQ
jgi:hypothetical protein